LAYAAIALILAFSFGLAKSIQKVALLNQFNPDNYGIGALLPSLAILFLILAIRGIRKDENLVRSADRLR
jgi:ABC-type proline/glycine betaine transport system permease subunit